MKRSTSALVEHSATEYDPACPREDDPRWQLALQVVAGPHFSRSPLLSKFLLYVVGETVAGRQGVISEHQIGVTVFGRSPNYRTDEDNIVRNYARQLRKRLAEHFSEPANSGSTRIDIPLGGYVPSFTTHALERRPSHANEALITPGECSQPGLSRPFLVSDRSRGPTLMRFLWLGAYTLVLIAFTWVVASRLRSPLHQAEPTDALWNAVLSSTGTTYVIPSDSGFNLLEDVAHTSLPLEGYIKGSYLDLPAVSLDSHTNQDLRTQQYTDFVSMKIVASLARLPNFDPQRVLLRFPRDLRVDDLKTANALIIGSASANPWASIGDSGTNFRIVPGRDMRGASIVNTKPLPGEAATYASRWNEPSHETYALILLIPNLSGTGNMLIIEGLDVAGTEAAGEALFHPDLLGSILEKARRADGGLHSFEVLLRSTSIQSNAAGTEIVAYRIH